MASVRLICQPLLILAAADIGLLFALQSLPFLSPPSLHKWLCFIRVSALIGLSLGNLFKGHERRELVPYLGTLCLLLPVLGRVQELLERGHQNHMYNWVFLLLSHVASALAMGFWTTFLPVSPASENVQVTAEKQKSKATIRRLLSYSKPDVFYLLGAFCFLTIAVLSQTFIPYFTGRVIDILSNKYKTSAFHNAILLMCLASVVSALSAGCRGGLFMFTLARLNKRIRNLLFTSLTSQEIGFFESTHTGEIISRLSTDTTVMSRSIAANVNIFLRSLINTIGMYFFMFKISWQLTLLTFIESPLTGAVHKLYNKYYQDLAKEIQDSMAKSDQEAAEVISSIKTVRSFATEEEEAKRYHTKLLNTQNLKIKRDFIRIGYLLFRRLLQLLMHIFILYCGKELIESDYMTVGNLVSFMLYQTDVGAYIQTLVHFHAELYRSVGAADKVFAYLDRTPALRNDGKLQPKSLRGHVEFRNVSFFYPTRPQLMVLKNVSFEVRSGEVTALVGHTGGGKTTCVSLLQRFYQPQSGQILLDGIPIEEYEHKYYHSKVALVSQEPILFARSIQENISYGLTDCPRKAVSEAAEKAKAAGFTRALKDGYDTDVGEKGGHLSGGQKQRIALARAIVRDPKVLILDEATSSLDVETEHLIQQELSKFQDQAIIVIAHRLKTVERANKILVMENGSIVEEGSHLELMQAKGQYYRLLQRDFIKSNNGE
ncbi:ABC-type oligopeptide transporter ABCB9-like [Hypanus sabinus]|uniref:ABC-type oligopeptide transporter ABCB9-like n=1 Tax=Hypanus sabinus TaxID=79690 RepID=UPI0028C4C50C|nr:ABC-type oligopeptide transporter ABCB9-like [Hypanus sabinus]